MNFLKKRDKIRKRIVANSCESIRRGDFMYEANGKQYIIKLNEFADEQGVSVRTVQKKLTAGRYQKQLEGEFLRTATDGTWLSAEAAEFLKSTFRTQSVGFVTDSTYERQISELKEELIAEKEKRYEDQQKFKDYMAQVTPLLQKASEQLALAEASEQNKQRAEALEAQNDDLRAEIKRLEELVAQERKTAQEASEELTEQKEENEELKNRKWYQLLFKR